MKPMEEQVSMFSPDSWSGKTSAGLSVPMEARTSGRSLKKSQKSQTKVPLFLDMRGGLGDHQELSWDATGASLGERMTLSFGVYRNGEEESVSLPISMDRLLRGSLLIVHGEKPIYAVRTRLSDILEKNPDPKYNLSPKACMGILRRAEKRGKELPEILREALERQAGL